MVTSSISGEEEGICSDEISEVEVGVPFWRQFTEVLSGFLEVLVIRCENFWRDVASMTVNQQKHGSYVMTLELVFGFRERFIGTSGIQQIFDYEEFEDCL